MKRVFITGGSAGLGLALAKNYKHQEWAVAISGRRNKDDVTEVESLGLTYYQVDVCDEKAMDEAISNFAEKGLDLVIANAGIAISQKVNVPDFKLARDIVQTNVIGVINTFAPAINYFLENKKPGHLVAIGSLAGYLGLPGSGAYSASKSAVQVFCETLQIDLNKHDIAVTVINPGWIKTGLTDKNHHPMPFLLDADKAAQKVVQGVSNGKKILSFPMPLFLVVRVLSIMPRVVYHFLMSIKWFNYSKKES